MRLYYFYQFKNIIKNLADFSKIPVSLR